MKRILINTACFLVLAGTIQSCKKTLSDNYLDPELRTSGSLDKLLTGMMLNKRIHPSYYDYATFILPNTAAFSQLTALSPGNRMYVPSPDYTEVRWIDYYNGVMPKPTDPEDYNYNGPGILNSYREMQTTYAALSSADQAKKLVYLQLAKVLLCDQTAQMVDLWGDIPFSKANSLNQAGRPIQYAPFDKAPAIYDTLIRSLKEVNAWLGTANVPNEIKASLTKQDLLLGGSLDGWRRYANSLRLRLLMRISYQNETFAKAEVTTMLNDPTTYPMVTGNNYNVVLKMSGTTFKSDLKSALTGSPYAPAFLVDTLMNAKGDPRTVVFWDSVKNQPYKGFPLSGTETDFSNGGFTTYDTVTFMYNYNVPGVLFTAAENSFLSAEANERWGAGAIPAATLYANGINQSVGFYYGINRSSVLSSGSWPVTPLPSQTAIDNYVANVAYTGSTTQKLSLIATQNWINFFILQAGQAWAEYRRTKWPALNFRVSTYGPASLPPSRLLYPNTEIQFNADNYAAVAGQDKRDNKIFWDVK